MPKQSSVKINPLLSRPHNLQRYFYKGKSHQKIQVNDTALENQSDLHRFKSITTLSYANHADDSEPKPIIEESTDNLAVEAAISIVINDIHYAVLMASPYQLEELALGFLFSEGLINSRSQLLDYEVIAVNSEIAEYQTDFKTVRQYSQSLKSQLQVYDVYIIELQLNQRCQQRIQTQKRMLAGRTGCGMCGITGLTQALPELFEYQQLPVPPPKLDSLLGLREQLMNTQRNHYLTGGMHAAATMYEGKLKLFEDVGRHNALDKLLGWQLKKNTSSSTVVMTSRLSIELVQKAIRAQVKWLIGMSAPTSTAVRVASQYGLGLGGFLRDNRVSFYTNFSE